MVRGRTETETWVFLLSKPAFFGPLPFRCRGITRYQQLMLFNSLFGLYLLFICLFNPRDGGLKRAKVKDTFKEEQQKNYSKMLVGNGSL